MAALKTILFRERISKFIYQLYNLILAYYVKYVCKFSFFCRFHNGTGIVCPFISCCVVLKLAVCFISKRRQRKSIVLIKLKLVTQKQTHTQNTRTPYAHNILTIRLGYMKCTHHRHSQLQTNQSMATHCFARKTSFVLCQLCIMIFQSIESFSVPWPSVGCAMLLII